MASPDPDTREDRLLNRSAVKGDAAGLRKALGLGADPNKPSAYLSPRGMTILGWLARWGHEEALEVLFSAGADPWQPFNDGPPSSFTRPVYETALRHHPRWGPVCLDRLDGLLSQGGVSTEEAYALLRHLQADSLAQPLEDRFLQRLERLPQTVLADEHWWNAALTHPTPHLMHRLQRQGRAPDVAWVLDFLHTANAYRLQHPNALRAWVEALPADQQADFFLGNRSTPGCFETGPNALAQGRDTLWECAAANACVHSRLVQDATLPDRLIRATRSDEAVLQLVLQAAQSADVDVGGLRYQKRSKLVSDLSWPSHPDNPKSAKNGDTLLDLYLSRSDSSAITVRCIQTLTKAGCVPTFRTLCLLLLNVTHGAKASKFAKTVDAFVRAGVDPEPADEPAAWTRVSNLHDAALLQARYRQGRMGRAWDTPEPAPPTRRLRM